MRFFKFLALVCIIIFLLSIFLLYKLSPTEVQIRRVGFQGVKGTLVGDLYLPTARQGRAPAILLCHGVEANKEVMGHLAVEFARRGMAALAFDYGGYGESERHNDEFSLMVADSLAAWRFLTQQPETGGAGATALVGHSMGVSYSVELAGLVPSITGVVGLGNEAIASTIPPRNVALAMGVYDAFHTLPDMLDTVSESTGRKDIVPDKVYGDFSNGSARALITSPYSDHGIEPLDPLLIQKAIEWVRYSMPGLSMPALKVRETYRAQARLATFAAGGTALMALLILLVLPVSVGAHGMCPPETDLNLKRKGAHVGAPLLYRAHFLIIAAAAIIGNISPPLITLVCTDVSLAALIAGSIAAALSRNSSGASDVDEAFSLARRGLISGAVFAVLIVACLLFGLLIGGFRAAFSLGYLHQIPAFLLYILTLRPYEGLCMLRAYSFHRYSEAWIPGITLSVILGLELIRPGIVMEIVTRITRTLVKAFQIKGPFKLHTSRAGFLGAVAAFAGLAYILYRRFEEGWLSGDAVYRMLLISLKFMIIPLALFIIIVNILPRRKS